MIYRIIGRWCFLILLALCASSSSAQLRVVTSNHYRIQTDLEPSLADDLAHRMDMMYDEYSRRLVAFSPQSGDRLFDVFIFQHHGQYLSYTQNRFPNTGGVFMSGKALAAYLDGQGRDQLRKTLQHEAFHQFAWSTIGRNVPVWLNEGLAQIFEEGIYDGQNFRIGQVPPRRLRQLQDDIRNHHIIDFRTFMATTSQEWFSNMRDKDRSATQYNQAWAMAQFLVFAEESPGRPRFRDRLIDMLGLLHDGSDANAAFTSAFSSNIGGFQQIFLDYAAGMQPTPAATAIEHQDILADMMVDLKSRGRIFTDISNYRQEIERDRYQIEYVRGSLHWTSESDPSRYFHDLTGSDFGSDRLFLVPRNGAPLPDMISKPLPGLQLHTRFLQSGATIEHELVVERPR